MKGKNVLAAVFLTFRAAFSVSAEVSWQSEIPKADRSKLSSLISALDSDAKKLSGAYESAKSAESRYARNARSLAAKADRAAKGGDEAKALLADLGDQRRLRWESARELAENRYGRPGPSGFESVPVLEARLEKSGAALSTLLSKHLPKLRAGALAALVADLEKRVAAHPDCPKQAFSELQAAAFLSNGAEKRRWALALSTPLPRSIAAFYADNPPGDQPFSAALSRFSRTVEACSSMKKFLPAAAAAAWYSDVSYAALPAPALASIASFLNFLSSASGETVSIPLGEYPEFDLAFSECAALSWAAFGLGADRFRTDLGVDAAVIERALKTAWKLKSGNESTARAEAKPDAASVRAAERMAAFLEGPASVAEILQALAALRTDPAALNAFRAGARYAAARGRLASAFAAAVEKAEKAGIDPTLGAVRTVKSDPAEPVVVFSYVTKDGKPILPSSFAPAFALSLSRSLGFRADAKKPEEAASRLEALGLFLTLPCASGNEPPDAVELETLIDGRAFYPAVQKNPAQALARDELLRARALSASARLGIPSRFVSSPRAQATHFAVFFSCAARYAERSRPRTDR